MTPAQVDELAPEVYEAMIRYTVRAQRDERRAERAAARRRR
jgi:hypothetical protein